MSEFDNPNDAGAFFTLDEKSMSINLGTEFGEDRLVLFFTQYGMSGWIACQTYVLTPHDTCRLRDALDHWMRTTRAVEVESKTG